MLKNWFGKKKPEEKAEEQPETAKEQPETAGKQPEKAADAASASESESTEPPAAESRKSRWSLFSKALEKTRKGLKSILIFRRDLDENLLSEIEAELYAADFGPELVENLVSGPDGIRVAWKDKRIQRAEEVRDFIKARLKRMLQRREAKLVVAERPPTVILVAGVNGTGKTTSIAKLAKMLRDKGHGVILAAADTFRAAAVEQLTIWSQRLGVEIVKGDPGSDPASVAYRSAEAALEHKADYLIVDTAGRLHTQKNLMRELAKIRNVLGKKIPGSPHECLLVLDATTGQNALNQARIFRDEIQVSGILLAKLDGTAKGGIVVTINNVMDIPEKFVGVGETLDDLEPFDADRFVDALLEA